MSETSSRIVEATFKAPQTSAWDKYRPLITRLYQEDHKPLREVISILREQHGFDATPRQYKHKMNAWKLHKYQKSEDVDELLQHYTKDELERTVQTGRDSSFTLHGRTLSRSKVQRYLRQRHLSETSRSYNASSSTWPRSEDFIFSSPGTLALTYNARPKKPNERSVVDIHCLSRPQSPTSTSSVLNSHRDYRSQGTYSLEVRSASPSSMSKEPLPACKSSNEYEESDSRRKRQKLSVTNLASSLEPKALACPFYKHNPWRYNPQNEDMNSAMRYRTCAGPGWESISRLRQHLFRAHISPKRCETCNTVFQSRNDLEDHVTDCRGGVAVDAFSTAETLSEEQQSQLRRKHLPGLTKEEGWMRIYHVLFPHDSSTPSPYYQSDNKISTNPRLASLANGEIDSLIQHLCNTLPQKIITELQGRSALRGNSTSPNASLSAPKNPVVRLGDHSAQTQSQPSTEADTSAEHSLPASAQELKGLISESVVETCTDWMKNRKEEDNDSDEDSEDDDVQSHSISTFSNIYDLSLPSMTSLSRYLSGYPETQREQTSTHYANLGTRPSDSDNWQSLPQTSLVRQTQPPQLDFPPYRFQSVPEYPNDLNLYEFPQYTSNFMHAQFLDSPMQPDVAESSNLEATVGGAFENSLLPDPRLARLLAPWQVAPDLYTTYPEQSNQIP